MRVLTAPLRGLLCWVEFLFGKRLELGRAGFG